MHKSQKDWKCFWCYRSLFLKKKEVYIYKDINRKRGFMYYLQENHDSSSIDLCAKEQLPSRVGSLVTQSSFFFFSSARSQGSRSKGKKKKKELNERKRVRFYLLSRTNKTTKGEEYVILLITLDTKNLDLERKKRKEGFEK